jgi:hypothetical protein
MLSHSGGRVGRLAAVTTVLRDDLETVAIVDLDPAHPGHRDDVGPPLGRDVRSQALLSRTRKLREELAIPAAVHAEGDLGGEEDDAGVARSRRGVGRDRQRDDLRVHRHRLPLVDGTLVVHQRVEEGGRRCARGGRGYELGHGCRGRGKKGELA